MCHDSLAHLRKVGQYALNDLAGVQKRSKETNRWFPTEEMETGRKKVGNANKMTFNTDAKPKKNLPSSRSTITKNGHDYRK